MVSTIRHKTHELSINLTSTEIVLVGHASESAGKLLRGTVTLSLTEPMKVRSVNLQFNGKMKVSWSEGKKIYLSYLIFFPFLFFILNFISN